MPEEQRPRVVLVNRCFVRTDSGLLVVRRAMDDTHYPGMWEVPGGKLDEGQDLNNAREREVLEETGLLVRVTHPMVAIDSYVIGGDGKYSGLPYVALFHITEVVGGKFALSHEHCGHKDVSYGEMLDLDLTPEVHKAAIILEKHLS